MGIKMKNTKKRNQEGNAVPLLKNSAVAKLLAILCGFIVAGVILAMTGYRPFQVFKILFEGFLGKPKYISNTIIKAAPILLTGLSVAFAFKVGLFNIGAEGQYIAGTIAAGTVGYLLDLPPILQIPAVLLSGMAAGALLGAAAGFLKARFGIHEVITSIMLNWIAFYTCNFVVNMGAFHMPNSTSAYPINRSGYTMLLYGWKTSEAGRAYFREHPQIAEVLQKTDVNFGFLIGIAAAVILSLILSKTTKGFELRAVGFNRDAAEFAGIGVKKNILQAMIIAGMTAGLSGALMITGVSPHKISTLGAFENMGFNGLSVSLIAGNSPIGCIFASLLFSGLLYGGGSVQQQIGAPSEIINICIGTIVFFVALTGALPVLADKLAKRGERHAG